MSWRPRVLLIGPGGMKALKCLGFLSVMEDNNFFEKTDTYCGVSAGSIISLLIISGYTIRDIIGETNKLNIFGDLENFELKTSIDKTGFMSIEPIRSHITNLVIAKFGFVPSLKSLFLQTNKSLVTVTLNVTDEKCEMMSPFSHPNLSCVDAVMFSINVPFLYYQLLHEGKVYLDGALGNPYPINYFDDGFTNILGLYIKNINPPSDEVISFKLFIFKIIDSVINQRRQDIISSSSPNCRHVCLETNHFGVIGSSMSFSDKVQLLVEGYNQGKIFIKNLDNHPKIDCPKVDRFPFPSVSYLPSARS